MPDPFIGEIRMFGGNFAPRGWALCDGQLLPIAQNDALFSLLGTIYGGDGRSTFGLPDLRGRIPIHHGLGKGLTERPLGARGGQETVTLTIPQLPAHQHTLQASSDAGDSTNPAGRVVGSGALFLTQNAQSGKYLAAQSETSAGGAQSHENMMPFQCVNFIIALIGVYPSHS